MLKTFIRDRVGDIYLNDSIRYQKPVILVPNEQQYPVVTPAATGAGRGLGPAAIFEGPASSVNEVACLIGHHEDDDNTDVKRRLTCEIYDTFYRRRLMNRDILVDHVFGQRLIPPEVVVTQLSPLKLVEGLFLEPQQTFEISFFNNSALGISHFYPHAEAIATQSPAWRRPDIKDDLAYNRLRKPQLYPFWLTTDAPVTIPAGGSTVAFMTVTRDIRVVLFACMQRFISAGAVGDVNNGYSMRIFDAQTQRPMQTQPVPGPVFGGNANVPYYLPTGWMIDPNSKVQLEFQNLITDAPTQVMVTYFGAAQFVGNR